MTEKNISHVIRELLGYWDLIEASMPSELISCSENTDKLDPIELTKKIAFLTVKKIAPSILRHEGYEECAKICEKARSLEEIYFESFPKYFSNLLVSAQRKEFNPQIVIFGVALYLIEAKERDESLKETFVEGLIQIINEMKHDCS